MPNWCNCQLIVTNSTPKLEAFLKGHGLSFEAIVKPNRPENDENNFGAVDAQQSAWGTKWDLDENDAKETADCLLNGGACSFDTAWSPPSEAIRVLSEITGASFELTFYEPGCWFWGKESIEDGYRSTDIDSESGSKEELFEFLVEEMGYDGEDARQEVFGDEEEAEQEEVERLKDEKNGLYLGVQDIAN
jgi:hypothetical protein